MKAIMENENIDNEYAGIVEKLLEIGKKNLGDILSLRDGNYEREAQVLIIKNALEMYDTIESAGIFSKGGEFRKQRSAIIVLAGNILATSVLQKTIKEGEYKKFIQKLSLYKDDRGGKVACDNRFTVETCDMINSKMRALRSYSHKLSDSTLNMLGERFITDNGLDNVLIVKGSDIMYGVLEVGCPYRKEFIDGAKAIKGRWGGLRWRFDAEKADLVMELVNKVYNVDSIDIEKDTELVNSITNLTKSDMDCFLRDVVK